VKWRIDGRRVFQGDGASFYYQGFEHETTAKGERMTEESDKEGMLMAVLCLLFGVFGAHRFYAGYKRSAWIQLFTMGGVGLWMFIDLLFILFGEFKDARGRKVNPWSGM
jgi:hypothetical protein